MVQWVNLGREPGEEVEVLKMPIPVGIKSKNRGGTLRKNFRLPFSSLSKVSTFILVGLDNSSTHKTVVLKV